MKKNFQVGQKVKINVQELYNRIGQVGEIMSIETWGNTREFMIKFPGSDYHELFFENEVVPVPKRRDARKSHVDPKPLLQVIVNTEGLCRTVRQERNEKGQFIKGARIGLLLNPTHVLHLAAAAKDYTVVMVSHHYTNGNQTVMSVNQTNGKGNGVTFINDGKASTPALHDSIFGVK